MPLRQIASALGVSVGSVSSWTRDIAISPAQQERNLREAGQARGRAWRERNRERRLSYQDEGRIRARGRDPLHLAGCMLYWAEGAKSRYQVKFTNSDLEMVRVFCDFLRARFGVKPERLSVRLNVYTNNGYTLEEIETRWLEGLDLPKSCLRGHTLDYLPSSSSGKKRSLPYGVCTVAVRRSINIVQHIYGAIQEYGGFEEPGWLDC